MIEIKAFYRLAAAVAMLAAVPASAANFVTNGGFESLTNGPNLGTLYTAATGWTVASPGGTYGGKGYSIFWRSGGADGVGAADNNGPGSPIVNLWGPGVDTLFNNGMPASSPGGGNYFASSTDNTYAASISQTLTGLTAGTRYRLSFDWAGAQLFYLAGQGFYGDTDDQWIVSLGGETHMTPLVPNQERHFTGWMPSVMHFTATSGTEVLTFLSNGTAPSGRPPMALLDNVVMTVPEPGTWALLLTGFGLVGSAMRRRTAGTVAA